MSTPDWSDPCAALEQVRAAIYALAAGEKAAWVEFGDRRVRYGDGDVAALRALEADLAARCEAQRTGRPRRFALSAGYRR